MNSTYEILFMKSTNMNDNSGCCMRKKISCNTSKVKLLNLKANYFEVSNYYFEANYFEASRN